MSPHRERVVRGRVASEHLVYLFDEKRSLVETIGGHLCNGWRRGNRLLVVARPDNWTLLAAALAASGCSAEELAASGRLVVLDAVQTLASFTVGGEPDRAAFDSHVGALVRRLCGESTTGLIVYGEMVDLLAAEGNFIAAERLEVFWNELSAECSFTLLCGYASSHFGDARHARHLDRICSQHAAAGSRDTDLLASWLLTDRRARSDALRSTG